VIGSVPLQGPQTNPSTVGTIARAEDSIQRAAAQAGMRAGELRGNVSTKTISTGAGTGTTRTTTNPLVRITVQASTRRKAQTAANALSLIVVEKLAPYTDRKIENLKERIAADQDEVDAIKRQAASSSDATAKAVFGVHLADVLDDQLQARQLLIQAQEIERPKVLTRAAAVKTTARSTRNSVVVAAFLGFVIGLIAALAWEPLVVRRRRRVGCSRGRRWRSSSRPSTRKLSSRRRSKECRRSSTGSSSSTTHRATEPPRPRVRPATRAWRSSGTTGTQAWARRS
jgi:hypothetical protein